MDIRIAMAGLAHGHGTGFLKDALKHEGVKIVGFYDSDKSRAQSASQEFNAPVFDSLDDLLSLSGANVLLTAAVNSEKAPIIIKGIESGLNIVADKPLVTRLEDLDAIERALDKNPKAKVYLMLTERYNPVLVTAKRLIKEGEIGKIASVINMRPHRLKPENRPDWMFDSKKYGGIINDIGVHDIDIACWISESEIDSILASHVSNLRFSQFPDFEDNGAAMFTLKNGANVFILESWFTPDMYPRHGEMKFIFHGTNGQITADPQNESVTMYSDTKALHNVDIIEAEEDYVSDPLKYFSSDNYKPIISTKDSLQAQRNALLCQSKGQFNK